jgi:polyhydroxyalkanoate synthase
MTTPLMHAQLAWLSHPQEMSETLTEFSTKLWELQAHSWHRALGMPSKDVVSPNPDDTRFADPIWSESATWDIVKEWYLMMTHQVQDMLYDTPGLSNRDRRRAAFWWRKWLNAMAPTNFLLTNPAAMQKAMETRGESLLEGIQQFRHRLPGGRRPDGAPDRFRGWQGSGDHAGQGRVPQSPAGGSCTTRRPGTRFSRRPS